MWSRSARQTRRAVHARSRRNASRPRLEALEDRTLLSIDPLFETGQGLLTLHGNGGDQSFQATLAPGGFVEVAVDGQCHSSDPASALFDPALAGATASSLAAIQIEGGGQATLTLSPQQWAGSLRVFSDAAVVAEDLAIAGQLTIQAPTITVAGTVEGSTVTLAGPEGVTIEAGGQLAADRIDVTARVFVNSGQLHADGFAGGQVFVTAANVLNAGRVSADGSGPGGAVRVTFTGSYVDTAEAVTSANGGSGGSVTIDGGTTGHLFSSGTIQATGPKGGRVDLFGAGVVLDAATEDASGELGGGWVRVGGGFQGKTPGVVNAQSVTVTPGTSIRANAWGAGGGGRVVVWADHDTLFDGSVSARGGPGGGAGGFVEVSGKGRLTYGGTADAGAAAGAAGTVLLDPKNLIISAAPDGVFPQFDLIDPHPTTGGFGSKVTVLSNGNVVVTNPSDDFGGSGAGAVYLFNGLTGALISSLVGNSGGLVGGGGDIRVLSNGNYLVNSFGWNGYRGAVTWGSGTTGVSGTVSAANSLLGSDPYEGFSTTITLLSNGNYLVSSSLWNGSRGAVTWGSGTTGVSGTISAANSLVGSNPNDQVGASGVTVLGNGNYVVSSPNWNGSRGAVTWGSGTAGVSGAVSAANSLVGSNPNDRVGGFAAIAVLSNGNYLVSSPFWNGNRGAVTWGDGSVGVSGTVSAANSLVGGNPNDRVGSFGPILLGNGNYLADSPFWDGSRGAVTWGSGTAGVSGTVSDANSLVGSNPNDRVGGFAAIAVLGNGNYVVSSPNWNGSRGAVTWGDGSVGVSGFVSDANSLVGSNPNDRVGSFGITVLSNSNYLATTPNWNGNRGAVTWADGSAGVSGTISAANSLVGSNPDDQVGGGGITLLSNGNYVVSSPNWNGNRGAVTWGDGSVGVSGTVSAANSLVGSNLNDEVGGFGNITPLGNGNYLVSSPFWNGNRGAVTWGDGSVGVSGTVSAANSLVGGSPSDQVGGNVTLLSNGNYAVSSPNWNGGRGAVTWGSGTAGVSGTVSAANSLVGGTANDFVGLGLSAITPLSNGNYLVSSRNWNGSRGAVTWGDGSVGVSGTVSAANSLVGSNPNDQVGGFGAITTLSNGNYLVRSANWNGNAGALTWGSGTAGVSGTVSAANSLVGSNPNDYVGGGPFGSIITLLDNGNYLVSSPFWNGHRGALTWGDGNLGVSGVVSAANSLVGSDPNALVGLSVTVLSNSNYLATTPNWNGNRGAVTWADGSAGVSGTISAANSLVGSNPDDQVGGGGITLLSNGNYVVSSPNWNGNRGAVTWVDGTTGQTLDGSGVVTAQNSLVGRAADAGPRPVVFDPVHQSVLAPFVSDGGGRVTVGLFDPNQFTYARGQAQTVTLTPDFLTRTLSTGTDVVLQASNDITVDDPITVHAGGSGGALTLQAGRSILLNASITTDNGALTLIANDTLAGGVVDAQRDPGNAVITMADGTVLDTGTGPLTIQLRDGAGRTNTGSGSLDLQTITAGSVTVANNGPSTGSDIQVGPVTTSGPQSYSNPHGTTTLSGNLKAAGNPITFTNSVVVSDGVSVGSDADTVTFAGTGTQTLQAGNGVTFSNVAHTGIGTLWLTGDLSVAGSFTNAAGTSLTIQNTGGLSTTGDFNDRGSVTIPNGATLSVGGNLNVAGGAALTVQTGGALSPAGNFTNQGSVSIGAGVTVNVGGTFTEASGAALSIANTGGLTTTGDFNDQGSVTVGSGASISVGGNLNVAGGAALAVLTGGALSSAADLNDLGSLVIGAGVTVGVGGNYTQGAAASLDIQLGGTGAGQFGQLAVAGTATLGGTLKATLVNGYVPRSGDAVPVLTYGSRSGAFATGPAGFALNYDDPDGILTVIKQ